jgi:hypothetical protein
MSFQRSALEQTKQTRSAHLKYVTARELEQHDAKRPKIAAELCDIDRVVAAVAVAAVAVAAVAVVVAKRRHHRRRRARAARDARRDKGLGRRVERRARVVCRIDAVDVGCRAADHRVAFPISIEPKKTEHKTRIVVRVPLIVI